MVKKKAVFLDKDGTLLTDVPFNKELHRMRFMEGVPEGLRDLQRCGFFLVVVSNQSGVARGYLSLEEVRRVGDHLKEKCRQEEVQLGGFYFCPHDPNGVCEEFRSYCICRKPREGMLLQAAKHHAIDLKQSWMVGDILHDVEAGNLAGCRTVLLHLGGETEWVLSSRRVPHFVARSFQDASRIIMENSP